jgi:predicted RNase H-like HicB family nuclease
MDRFTAVYQRDGDWWVAFVEELPGANTQGRTLDEARDNLRDAVQMILDANRMHARGKNEKS